MHQPDPATDRTTTRDDVALRYLELEFATAWRHLGGLENKRLALFVGYGVSSSLLLLAFVLGQRFGLPAAFIAVLFLWWSLMSYACRRIALSERQAAERYRNKINLLRRNWLDLARSDELWAMQRSGAALALQVDQVQTKSLRFFDIFRREHQTTALYMKIVYDAGAALGLLGALLVAARLV